MEEGLPSGGRTDRVVAEMAIVKKILGDRRFHRLAGVVLVLGAGAVLLVWKLGVDGAMLKAWWHQAEIYLLDRPWLLFAGLVLLPALPIPTSALLILAGTVWRERPVTACAVCLLALALNMTWTYWVAARPARGLVEKLLAASTLRIPALPQGDDLRLILIMRLTPGLPFFVQNYTLGFFRVPFRLYLPLSMGCSGLIASGVVLSTAGVADGNLTAMLTGLPLIVLGVVVVQMIRQRLAAKSAER
jgi:uncharacterized membrane protein YdjX (TVP38/TMEM64 family)